jgi:hypothetical protein
LPDAFTDYKGATKSRSVVKRGRVDQTKKDNTPNKCSRKEKTRHLQKTVNMSQPRVDRHLVNIPQSNTQACYREENASTSKNLDTLILGNHETSTGIQEISINYTSFR